jgi:hypothetical protein
MTQDDATAPGADNAGASGDASPDAAGSPDGSSSSPDAGVITPRCKSDSECPTLSTTPVGCAIPSCNAGTCVYTAIDGDGDGHAMANCKPTDGSPALPGDDCTDDDPLVYPGAPCSRTEAGVQVIFPTGTPLGACRSGSWACVGIAPVCKGAIAPAAVEDCAAKNDANCNGIPDDGCAVTCVPSSVQACGNMSNKPLPCKTGTRVCSATGTAWGPCVGNVEPKPRDCTSAIDNDCSGVSDVNELGCRCPGSIALGQTQACTVLAQRGICAAGLHTCLLSPDKTTAVFGPCVGNGPQPRNCTSPLDNDCNGVPDNTDIGCF